RVGDVGPADAGADIGAGAVGVVPRRMAGAGVCAGVSVPAWLLPGAAARGVPATAGEGDPDPSARAVAGMAQPDRRIDRGAAVLLRRLVAGGEPCLGQWLCDDVLPRLRADEPGIERAADADARAGAGERA